MNVLFSYYHFQSSEKPILMYLEVQLTPVPPTGLVIDHKFDADNKWMMTTWEPFLILHVNCRLTSLKFISVILLHAYHSLTWQSKMQHDLSHLTQFDVQWRAMNIGAVCNQFTFWRHCCSCTLLSLLQIIHWLVRAKLTGLPGHLDCSHFKEHSSFWVTLFGNISDSVSHARYYTMPVHSLRRIETLFLLT